MRKFLKLQGFLAGRSYYDFPAEEQRVYIDKLGEPIDDIDRSYKQYLCQRYFMPLSIKLLNDIATMAVMPLLVFYYSFKSLFIRKGKKVECIGEDKGMPEIIPEELKQKYEINIDCWFTGVRLSLSDVVYVLRLALHYPRSPLFVLKNMVKVAKYSYMIYTYEPKAIVVYNEYSFTSSLLTDYCHKFGVKHINVMHGEKLAIIRDSYFHYDECYVWDEYYVDLFRGLMAEITQFIVALPPSMKIDCEKYKNVDDFADYKYYLAMTSEEKLLKIVDSLSFIKNNGKSIKYCLHPRYSEVSLVERIVGKENIEYPSQTSIIRSIANCGCAIGSYTTVLNQAYHSHIPVILDDVAEKEMFDKLKSFKYILIDKGLNCLSVYKKYHYF